MGIIIGADIVPVKTNQEQFTCADLDYLIGKELQDILNRSDLNIFNLEVPLTDTFKPITKNGANLIASPLSVKGFIAMKIGLLALSNNHIMDQDELGLKNTINALNNAGIAYIGAGRNKYEAKRPCTIKVNGKKVGIYACTEHEFSIAGDNTYGANPYDSLDSMDHVFELKASCYYVIVLYHGGKENYRYPSPLLQNTCRKFVDKGADLVICQHSHCIGCEEDYKQGKIVYGQGNFLFDNSKRETWQTSLLIHITDDFNVQYYPLVKKGAGVRLANDKEKNDIMGEFIKRSNEIKENGIIERKYKELAQHSLEDYIIRICGKRGSVLYKASNKILCGKLDRLFVKRYLRKTRIIAMNYIECETHRELLLEGLKSYE